MGTTLCLSSEVNQKLETGDETITALASEGIDSSSTYYRGLCSALRINAKEKVEYHCGDCSRRGRVSLTYRNQYTLSVLPLKTGLSTSQLSLFTFELELSTPLVYEASRIYTAEDLETDLYNFPFLSAK